MTSGADADFAVVGAGPAGAWTAFRLATAGARVLLLDGSHPREKPCGGGLTGRALHLVRDAVPTATLTGVPITQATFTDRAGGTAVVPLRDRGVHVDSSLVVIDRRSFDGRLLEAARTAGAEVIGERVSDVSFDAGGAVIRTQRRSLTSAFVVGADGATSLVRRRVRGPFSHAQLSLSTGVYAHGVSSDEIVIEFERDPSGYIWSFPRTDHLAIGICAQANETSATALKTRLSQWVAAFPSARGSRLAPYAWPIPSLAAADFDDERPAGDRWALVGDAAGLVDPITREGLFFALHSGGLLADALLGPGASAAQTYERTLRSEIYPELAHAARLKRGFFRSGFTHLLVQALRESPAVNAIMADLVAGTQPYSTLKRRLVKTFELRLAWRLLSLEVRGRLGRSGNGVPRPSRQAAGGRR